MSEVVAKVTTCNSEWEFQWIRIEDLEGILNQFKPERYHPDDPRYNLFWQTVRSKCIEGIWYQQFGQYRYVPGRLGFYGNYCTIVETDKKTKARLKLKPSIRDIEWHISYYYLEAQGFSGFEDDDEYTCNWKVLNPDAYHIVLEEKITLFNKKGFLKEFIHPRDYLFQLHDKPLGRPLYYNDAKNFVILGSRGGGKSYTAALMCILFELIFDGEKYYKPGDTRRELKAEIDLGSGRKDKSSELAEKIEASLDELALNHEFGVWGKPGDDEYEPCPFWKRMTGHISANNKDNPWRNTTPVKIKNEWKEIGTGSTLYHNVYSTNKRDGGQSGAGGRRNLIVYEEIGLMELFIEAWLSNTAVVKTDGEQFGVQWGIGTSGNIETLHDAMKIFTHPEDYNCLKFRYGEQDQCLFLPAYITDKRFKDIDGNTDIPKAIEFYQQEEKKASKSTDPKVLIRQRMNYPLKITDMWLSEGGSLMPIKEAEERERALIHDNTYQTLGSAIELYWDSAAQYGVNYQIKTNGKPIYDFPIKAGDELGGEFMMYISPDKLKINGVIPNDAIIVLHDPYISDELDKGGSLGAAYYIVNPKYEVYGLPGNDMAAAYIGKNLDGIDRYNEILEMGMALYGNPVRNLWYEANRGDRLRAYFLKKKKADLLCLRPQFEQGQFIYSRTVSQTGYIVGNSLAKISLIDALRDWLLEKKEINGIEYSNLERIPCIFTVRQIKSYTLKGNFDGVSALLGITLAIGEQNHRMMNKSKTVALQTIRNHINNRWKRYST